MGRTVQKRLVRKLDLEMMLSQIEPHPSPSAELEQYSIPTDVASAMLFLAAYANDDVVGKTILDLGCGTGRLALGAAFLGAKWVVGVDIDRTAIEKAIENSAKVGLKERVDWVAGDIESIRGSFETVLQNPPFGVQKRSADRRFLEWALEAGNTVYSLHKGSIICKSSINRLRTKGVEQSSPTPFLRSFIEEHGGRIRAVYAMLMSVPHMFSYHTKGRHEFVVDLYVIEKEPRRVAAL